MDERMTWFCATISTTVRFLLVVVLVKSSQWKIFFIFLFFFFLLSTFIFVRTVVVVVSLVVLGPHPPPLAPGLSPFHGFLAVHHTNKLDETLDHPVGYLLMLFEHLFFCYSVYFNFKVQIMPVFVLNCCDKVYTHMAVFHIWLIQYSHYLLYSYTIICFVSHYRELIARFGMCQVFQL